MQSTRSLMLPVELLWQYREFKRDEVPAPRIPFVHTHSADEVTRYVGLHGIEPVELSIIGNSALLTDGNHRIVAARKLGYKKIPVTVIVFFNEDGRNTFYTHTLERFKPIVSPLRDELNKAFFSYIPNEALEGVVTK